MWPAAPGESGCGTGCNNRAFNARPPLEMERQMRVVFGPGAGCFRFEFNSELNVAVDRQSRRIQRQWKILFHRVSIRYTNGVEFVARYLATNQLNQFFW